MAISDEITRLQSAKSALKTSIEGKGVTVPSTAKLEDYPALVDSIEAGGGSGDDNWYLMRSLSRAFVFTKTDDTTWTEMDAGFISFNRGEQIYFQYKGEKYYVNGLDIGDNPLSKTGQPTVPIQLRNFHTATITKDASGNFTAHMTYDE